MSENPSRTEEKATRPRYSVIVPVVEWSPQWEMFVADLREALRLLKGPGEVLAVFDGHLAREAASAREGAGRGEIRIVELHQRMGEAAVLAAGLAEARGAVMVRVPVAAGVDLSVLPELVREVESGTDCALAMRVGDDGKPVGGIGRRLWNGLVSRLARTEIRDLGCQVSAFGKEAAAALPPRGNLHRYLPVLAAVEGLSAVYVPARARTGGRNRVRPSGSAGARWLDLAAALFVARSTGSPLRFFGLLGLGPLVAGTAITLWLVWERLFQARPLADRPLLLLGLLLITAGVQAVAIGFLGELMVFLHFRDRYPDRVRPLTRTRPVTRKR